MTNNITQLPFDSFLQNHLFSLFERHNKRDTQRDLLSALSLSCCQQLPELSTVKSRKQEQGSGLGVQVRRVARIQILGYLRLPIGIYASKKWESGKKLGLQSSTIQRMQPLQQYPTIMPMPNATFQIHMI